MREKTVTIKNQTGLHARPAALLVSEAAKYQSVITVWKGEKKANLKSLLGLLSLGICHNDEIKIVTDGADEKEALEKISVLVNGFND